MPHPGTLLVLAIHRSDEWWSEVARHTGFERVRMVTDRRGRGDRHIIDEFYAARRARPARNHRYDRLDASIVDDVIARCRVLRWLPRDKATRMVLAMADVMDRVLGDEAPDAITTWPIDCYLTDVLTRLADKRGIPTFELTASTVPGMAMLMYRGQLILREEAPDPDAIAKAVAEVADPLYLPAYVPAKARYTMPRWLRIFIYFRLRALAFWVKGLVERDPLNIHYLDSRVSLGHKPRLSDVRLLAMFDRDWQARLEAVPIAKRLFVALQLFPEASIDYWIPDRPLIEHDDVLVAVAEAFSRAGYTTFIKDHPLQFGFRRCDLIERLRQIPNVVLVPYEVSGNALLAATGLSFTQTGTLGMQAALIGMKSVTCEAYYHSSGDFVTLEADKPIAALPNAVDAFPVCNDIPARQRRILGQLLRGSFPGDFMSFRDFDPASPNPAVAALGQRLGEEIAYHLRRS